MTEAALQARIGELENELSAERRARLGLGSQIRSLRRQVSDAAWKDAEIARLRRELNEIAQRSEQLAARTRGNSQAFAAIARRARAVTTPPEAEQ